MIRKNYSLFNYSISNLLVDRAAGRGAGTLSKAEVKNACNCTYIRLPTCLNEMHMNNFTLIFNC
jgi:hypothetical protein